MRFMGTFKGVEILDCEEMAAYIYIYIYIYMDGCSNMCCKLYHNDNRYS